MIWPVLSEATFEVRELGTCKASRGEEMEASRRKCLVKELTVVAAALHSFTKVMLLLCLNRSPVQLGELTQQFRAQFGDGKTGRPRDCLLSLRPAAVWLDRMEDSLKEDKTKKTSSGSLEEAELISRPRG